MTIAACYLTPEGAVLGADSTSTFYFPDSKGTLTPHYFNYAQKVFEVGENSTLGVTMWGLGGLGLISHRMLVANLADQLASKNPASVQEAALRWTDMFWKEYTTAAAVELKRVQDLLKKASRTPAEE